MMVVSVTNSPALVWYQSSVEVTKPGYDEKEMWAAGTRVGELAAVRNGKW